MRKMWAGLLVGLLLLSLTGCRGTGQPGQTVQTAEVSVEFLVDGRVYAALTVAANTAPSLPGPPEAAPGLCFGGWADDRGNLLDPERIPLTEDTAYYALFFPVLSGREPGFFQIGGWLYCLGADGALLRNTTLGTLTFGPDGRYTSGDGALDEMVAARLEALYLAYPDAEAEEMLRQVYLYCRESFRYVRRDTYAYGEHGWEIGDAKKIFDTGYGSCYNFSAAFWAMARGMGYEATCVSGSVFGFGEVKHHGWVEIPFDGVPYVFDPEMDYGYRYMYDIQGFDFYKLSYADTAFLQYTSYETGEAVELSKIVG